MGRDKATVRVGTRTLLGWVKAAATSLGYPVRVIRRDLISGLGPVGGVHTALRTSSARWIVFLSCDMPFVPIALLERVVKAKRKGVKGVFVCHGDRVGFPFALRTDQLPEAEKLIQEERATLQKLAFRIGADALAPRHGDIPFLANINTPEDLHTARAVFRAFGKGI